jgi:hypothetical protein
MGYQALSQTVSLYIDRSYFQELDREQRIYGRCGHHMQESHDDNHREQRFFLRELLLAMSGKTNRGTNPMRWA